MSAFLVFGKFWEFRMSGRRFFVASIWRERASSVGVQRVAVVVVVRRKRRESNNHLIFQFFFFC